MAEKTYIAKEQIPVAADVGNGIHRVCVEITEILRTARSKGFPEKELAKLADLRSSLVMEGYRVSQLGSDRYLAERRAKRP